MKSVYHVKLRSPFEAYVIDEFVTPDFTEAYDKMDEWESDHAFNTACTLSLIEWVDGNPVELESRTVY
jgi:hypothetical protein